MVVESSYLEEKTISLSLCVGLSSGLLEELSGSGPGYPGSSSMKIW